MCDCPWPQTDLEKDYHQFKWCFPSVDDHEIFRWLILELMQAGLSWALVLEKAQAMDQAFDNFDYHIIANYSAEQIEEVLENPSVIRNRRKIEAMVANAKAYIKVQEEFKSFSHYIWQFVDYQPIDNRIEDPKDTDSQTELSQRISKDMKKRGFKFVGPTIAYSFMQAVGLVNDHLISCQVYPLVKAEAAKLLEYSKSR